MRLSEFIERAQSLQGHISPLDPDVYIADVVADFAAPVDDILIAPSSLVVVVAEFSESEE